MERNEKTIHIGILTFQNAFNYGALLQAFALQEKCKELGTDAQIINYQNRTFNSLYRDFYKIDLRKGAEQFFRFLKLFVFHFSNSVGERRKMAQLQRFIDEHFALTPEVEKDGIQDELEKFDLVVVGSDQVWNTPLTGFDDTYFLPFDVKTKRISYAASIGKDYVSGYEMDLLRNNMPKYDAISVREKKASRLIYEHTNFQSDIVLDPTLLFSGDYWKKIAAMAKRKPKKKYVLLYIIQKQKKLADAAVRFAKVQECEIISLSEISCDCKYTVMRDASIEEFLYLIANAECVFSSSFHGIAFSINFNRHFYYELADYYPNNNSRIAEIADTFGLSERNIDNLEQCPKTIDWKIVNQVLAKKREDSVSFLSKCICERKLGDTCEVCHCKE